MSIKLEPLDNIVRFGEVWLESLIGTHFFTPDGKEWIIGWYDQDTEQLMFVPADKNSLSVLGEKYIERGHSSLSN